MTKIAKNKEISVKMRKDIINSLKTNLLHTYSTITEDGKVILNEARFKGKAEYLFEGSWMKMKTDSFYPNGIYRIASGFN